MFRSLILSLCLFVPASFAGSFSYDGIFQHDTDVQFFSFTLLQDTPGVTLRTYGYGGGTNAAGTTYGPGGFNVYLNLYLADGTQMNPGVGGACAGTPLSADPTTGICGDVFYPTEISFPGGVWSAGTYIVALSLDANPGVGNLQDGFFANAVLGLSSPANFTCGTYQGFPASIPTDAPFCDSLASPTVQRTGQWALDILNVDNANAVPEPGTIGLGLIGGAILAARMRRKRS